MILPPGGTVVFGVKTRTGENAEPETPPENIEEKINRSILIAGASTPTERPVSTLEDKRKPPDASDRAPPRESPFKVMVLCAPVSTVAPAVVRTIWVLVAVTAGAVPVKLGIPAAVMDVTDPMKYPAGMVRVILAVASLGI